MKNYQQGFYISQLKDIASEQNNALEHVYLEIKKLSFVYAVKEGDRSTNVKILQNFNHVTVILSTNESDSRSVSASFDIDEKRGVYALYYTYVNEPNINRYAVHGG